jgi:hypothetical protein
MKRNLISKIICGSTIPTIGIATLFTIASCKSSEDNTFKYLTLTDYQTNTYHAKWNKRKLTLTVECHITDILATGESGLNSVGVKVGNWNENVSAGDTTCVQSYDVMYLSVSDESIVFWEIEGWSNNQVQHNNGLRLRLVCNGLGTNPSWSEYVHPNDYFYIDVKTFQSRAFDLNTPPIENKTIKVQYKILS